MQQLASRNSSWQAGTSSSSWTVLQPPVNSMIGKEETTALLVSLPSATRALPHPAHQNMAVSWQISPWKDTAKPAAHTWHHFSCLYQALPWDLHTLCWDTRASTQHHGSAGLQGHQKVHRVWPLHRSRILLLTHTWACGVSQFPDFSEHCFVSHWP